MKILVDTNVILDVVLDRQPFVKQAKRLLQTAQQKNITLFLTATTITDLYYIIRKAKSRDIALNFIDDLLQIVEVAAVDKSVIVQALQSNIADFEDAVQENAAKKEAITMIVTRNEADFQKSNLKIYTPEAFLKTVR